jgi:ABC-type bacteriocin/lantibiotic exporter with double-glycine peptidase domain
MPQLLPVPYHPQIVDGYCLAACAQMILDYWQMPASQEAIARRLGIEPSVGVPAGRISELSSAQLAVVYESGEWETIAAWLDQQVPVIAMVQAGELPQWREETFQHAVVVVGYDAADVWILDPAARPAPLKVSVDEFMLAWGEIDFRFAVLLPA